MSWGTKNRPPPPSVRQEHEFIEWLLRYGKDFDIYRAIYHRDIDKYVRINLESVRKELSNNPDSERLSDRLGAMCQFYAEQFMPLVNRKGGIHLLEPQFQAHVAMLQIKVQVLHYILKYKYNDTLTSAMEGVAGPLEDLYPE